MNWQQKREFLKSKNIQVEGGATKIVNVEAAYSNYRKQRKAKIAIMLNTRNRMNLKKSESYLRKELRERREKVFGGLVLSQRTGVNLKKSYNSVSKNNLVRYLNRNVDEILQSTLGESDPIIQFRIAYVYSKNPQELTLKEKEAEPMVITNSIRYSDLIDIIRNKGIAIKDWATTLGRPDSSTYVKATIIGFNVMFDVGEFDNTANEALSILKAFSPSQDQLFHKMTLFSTTNNKICIWETYYGLYLDTNHTMKWQAKAEAALEKQKPEVIAMVKKGELLKFLQYKSNETQIPMYVQMFRGDEKAYKVNPDGKVIEIPNLDLLDYEKVFFYSQNHVSAKRPVLGKKKDAVYQQIAKKDIPEEKKEAKFILKPIKAKAEILLDAVLSYDFETFCLEDGTAVPFCLCLYGQIKGEETKKDIYGNNIVQDFCDYLDSIATKADISKTKQKTKIPKIYIYGFNNSRFDNLFIWSELVRRNAGTKCIVDGTAVKYIKYFNIEIMDLSLYYVGSLEAVNTAFFPKDAMVKGVYPYTFPNKDNLFYKGEIPKVKYWSKNGEQDIQDYKLAEKREDFDLQEYTTKYCMLDAMITYKIAQTHLSVCVGELAVNKKTVKYDVRSKCTGAGIALGIFQQAFLGENLYQSPENIQEKERQAFKGGRTEVFKKEFHIEEDQNPMFYCDINSSYPFSMTQEMPYEYKQTLKLSETKEKKEREIKDTNLYFARSEYRGTDKFFIPNLVKRSDKGDIIATKNTDWSYQWGVELKEAMKNGCVVFAKEELVYKTKFLFKEFAEYMYNERLKIKKTNVAMANFYKLCMNSLYGKFGSKETSSGKLCYSQSEIYRLSANNKNFITDFTVVNEDSIYVKYRNTDGDKHIGSLIRFASYITAIARTNLAIFMRGVKHEHVYYCDTDSVFCDVEPPKELVHQDRLGGWKKEDFSQEVNGVKHQTQEIRKAIFLAPKSYYIEPNFEGTSKATMKAKGQPKKGPKADYYDFLVDEIDNQEKYKDLKKGVTDFDNGKNYENGKLVLIKENDGTVSKGAVIKNENMFFRSLNGVKIKPQDRTMMTVYNKRIWHGNNSEAFDTIEEWGANRYK